MSDRSSLKEVSIKNYKRSKIIATVGPSTNNYEAVRAMIKAGANGLRLNFSHGTNEERVEQIEWIRRASKELNKPVAIIQDLQGPKIRLGDFEDIINVKTGQELSFKYKSDYLKSGHIPLQYDISTKAKPGERLYLYDGKVHTVITDVEADGVVRAKAQNNGILIKRKGMNLPDTNFGGDIITKKDQADIAFGSTLDIDYVALSFVQSADDIQNLRKRMSALNYNAKIIAKIETGPAVEDIESIVQATDAIMVARGDLAVETPAESVPIIQRNIIGLGQKYAKPTIVATQMLATMTDNPEPSRAEVSDVATAVIIGADCLMLSDETASGSYPLEAVKVMKRVILYTESHMPLTVKFPADKSKSTQRSISKALITLAEDIEAAAIVAESKSGATALQIAARRSNLPLIAVTSDVKVEQQLAIVYSVKSYRRPDNKLAAAKLTDWLREAKIFNKGDTVVTASGKYPGVVGTTDTIKVRVLE